MSNFFARVILSSVILAVISINLLGTFFIKRTLFPMTILSPSISEIHLQK